MSSAIYHIDQKFSNGAIDFKVSLINIFASSVKRFGINFRTGIIVKLRNDVIQKLSSIYVYSEGYKALVDGFDKIQADQEYESVKLLLSNYRHIYRNLERRQFLNNKQIAQLCENTLYNYYDIEHKMRIIAFSDEIVPEDKILTEVASNLSLSSIPEQYK